MGLSRSRGRGFSRSRGRGCLEVEVGGCLEVEAGGFLEVEGPSNRFTNVVLFGVRVRQLPSGTCFSYSKILRWASASVLSESSPLQLFSDEDFDLLVV